MLKTKIAKIEKYQALKNAVSLARIGHSGQLRKGPMKEPFYNHPRRVCKSYLKFEHKTHAGVLAALCHDLVEDTYVTPIEIEKNFGVDVAILVNDLTKPKHVSSDDYARSIYHWQWESKKLKLCDIEDNILSSELINSQDRKRMLIKWKNYLEKLFLAAKGTMNELMEFYKKWNFVYNLLQNSLMECSA